MGYGISQEHKGADRTHAALRDHPNFQFPTFPKRERLIHAPLSVQLDVAEFVLEAVACFVSPPKVEGEDEHFECVDLATAIREKLGPEILNLFRLERFGPRARNEAG